MKMQLIRSLSEEIITEQELRNLLETKTHPIAYDGFEPSGLAHLPFGVYRALLLEDLLRAGIRFKLYLADWFAWINNKMGGDLEKIKECGRYFLEVWRAAGIDLKNVEVVWASDLVSDEEYWKKVILIAKNTSVSRATRCLTIMGRKSGELTETAQFFYPMMQVADIFHLDVDICQLGLDQRRANILAREIAEKIGFKKPVIVSHHMLMGLQGAKQLEGFDEDKKRDAEISGKMSKSKPESCIYVHDSISEIERKIKNAFCPPKIINNNPILDYCKHIIFRKFKSMKIERKKKFGGDIEFHSYDRLEKSYMKGDIHPLDLKISLVRYLDTLIRPIRKHFERGKAKELYKFVRKQEATR